MKMRKRCYVEFNDSDKSADFFFIDALGIRTTSTAFLPPPVTVIVLGLLFAGAARALVVACFASSNVTFCCLLSGMAAATGGVGRFLVGALWLRTSATVLETADGFSRDPGSVLLVPGATTNPNHITISSLHGNMVCTTLFLPPLALFAVPALRPAMLEAALCTLPRRRAATGVAASAPLPRPLPAAPSEAL
jgi:hypothetical protein